MNLEAHLQAGERALAHIWKATALRGVLAIAFAVVILIWPNVGLTTLIALFGAYALVSGVATLAGAFRLPIRGGQRAWLVFEGLLGIAVGVVVFVDVGTEEHMRQSWFNCDLAEVRGAFAPERLEGRRWEVQRTRLAGGKKGVDSGSKRELEAAQQVLHAWFKVRCAGRTLRDGGAAFDFRTWRDAMPEGEAAEASLQAESGHQP